MGPIGPFFVTNVDMVFAFGMTELKAQLAWDENVSGLSFVEN
jgi:hypothetical protein